MEDLKLANKMYYDESDYDESKEEDYKKVYSVKMKCVNCGFSSNEYYLPKKQIITKNILENTVCNGCDCKSTLIKDFVINKVVSSGNLSSSSNSKDCDYLSAGLVGFGVGLLFGG